MHFFLPVLFSLFFLDALTKSLAKYYLSETSFSIIDGFFSFTLAFNTGVAFSFPFPYWAQILTTLLFLCGVLWWARKYFYTIPTLSQWGITLLLAGVLGNFWERVIFEKVTDFIYLYSPWFSFPIFNIADISIFIGVLLWFFGEKGSEESKK